MALGAMAFISVAAAARGEWLRCLLASLSCDEGSRCCMASAWLLLHCLLVLPYRTWVPCLDQPGSCPSYDITVTAFSSRLPPGNARLLHLLSSEALPINPSCRGSGRCVCVASGDLVSKEWSVVYRPDGPPGAPLRYCSTSKWKSLSTSRPALKAVASAITYRYACFASPPSSVAVAAGPFSVIVGGQVKGTDDHAEGPPHAEAGDRQSQEEKLKEEAEGKKEEEQEDGSQSAQRVPSTPWIGVGAASTPVLQVADEEGTKAQKTSERVIQAIKQGSDDDTTILHFVPPHMSERVKDFTTGRGVGSLRKFLAWGEDLLSCGFPCSTYKQIFIPFAFGEEAIPFTGGSMICTTLIPS